MENYFVEDNQEAVALGSQSQPVIDYGGPGPFSPLTVSAATAIPQPWDMTITGDGADPEVFTATFKKCYFERDSLTLYPTDATEHIKDLTFTLPATTSGHSYYLGYSYDTSDTSNQSIAIIGGSLLNDVSETETPTTGVDIVKTPLYKISFTNSWKTTFDFRNMPSVGLYGY